MCETASTGKIGPLLRILTDELRLVCISSIDVSLEKNYV